MADEDVLRDPKNGKVLRDSEGKPFPMDVYNQDPPNPDNVPEDEVDRLIEMLDKR